MTDRRSVLFVMEGGTGVGLGHVERCRVLADMLADRGHVVSAALRGPRGLLTVRGWPQSGAVIEADAASEPEADAAIQAFAEALSPDWACIDGYVLAASGLASHLREQGARVLMFEDLAGAVSDMDADLIVNQSAGAETSQPGHRIQGPSAALVDPAFPAQAQGRQIKERAEHILITFGGADPTGLSRKVLNLLDAVDRPGLIIDLVVGPYFKDRGPFTSRHRLIVHEAPVTLAPFMMAADLMITTASTTCWQAAAAGLPMMAVHAVDNQAALVETLRRDQAAVVCSGSDIDGDAEGFVDHVRVLIDDAHLRQRLSTAARRLVDGRGAARITRAMGL